MLLGTTWSNMAVMGARMTLASTSEWSAEMTCMTLQRRNQSCCRSSVSKILARRVALSKVLDPKAPSMEVWMRRRCGLLHEPWLRRDVEKALRNECANCEVNKPMVSGGLWLQRALAGA